MISKEDFKLLRHSVEKASDNVMLLETTLEFLVFGLEVCRDWDGENLEQWILAARKAIDDALQNGIAEDWITHTAMFRQLRQAERQVGSNGLQKND